MSNRFEEACARYRELGVRDSLPGMSDEEALALLATDGMLVKRPVLFGDGVALVGFRETEWQTALVEGRNKQEEAK